MEKILPSGATLMITMANFEKGNKLLKAVSHELESIGISLGLGKGKLQDFFDLDIDKDGAINTLKNAAARMISSDAIEQALWACMDAAAYNGVRITRSTFEDEKARGDYLIVAKEVLVANLTPFFPGLSSKFMTAVGKLIESQKSALTPTT